MYVGGVGRSETQDRRAGRKRLLVIMRRQDLIWKAGKVETRARLDHSSFLVIRQQGKGTHRNCKANQCPTAGEAWDAALEQSTCLSSPPVTKTPTHKCELRSESLSPKTYLSSRVFG